MTPADFRRLYDYHFALNRLLWERGVAPLTAEQFRRPSPYSVGSVRNQVVHMLNMEERWLAALRGQAVPGLRNPVYFGTAEKVRALWDTVEADLCAYLANLRAEDLSRPVTDTLATWEVLFHVLNHGTDHRAQTLALLEQLGVPTFAQDYALFVMGKLER